MLKRNIFLSVVCLLWLVSGCVSKSESLPQPADTLTYYSWSGDYVRDVIPDFAKEYGVDVIYVEFGSQEEAIENLRLGNVYDIVVLENQLVPLLVAEGLLHRIDYANVPNFRHISPNFRDLMYDPGNVYAIPYSWGTTGLLVRSDLVDPPVTKWADLWRPDLMEQAAVWPLQRYLIGAALLSLGYSVNSENPAELEDASALLLALGEYAIMIDSEEETIAPQLVSGEAVLALGWAYDVWMAQEESDLVEYVLPEEGAILWGDNFVVPASSVHKEMAEKFINYLLRPEVSAHLIEANYYPMPNDAAIALLPPELQADELLFPTDEDMHKAELLLGLSKEGQQLHDAIWARFLTAIEK